MSNDDEISGSALGTKEYWEHAYENDLENYEETDDSGEIWFGRPCQQRMVKWIKNCTDIHPEKCRLLDLGCGNGELALSLKENGYRDICGVDYAPSAIKLARQVAENRGFTNVRFELFDILDDSPGASSSLHHSFDVLLDKGTFDAIGLMANGSETRRLYKRNAARFIDRRSPNRLLIIASCNSTKEELLEFFAPEFAFVDHILAPNKMTFGGKTGSTVTTVIMRLTVDP